MKTSLYIARRYLVSKSSNNAINSMSFLAVFGVLISSAALFVVLSGFNGLKEYTLEFVSYASPDIQASASSGKSFYLNETDFEKLVSQPEFSSVFRAVKERVLIKSNRNSQIVQLNGVDERFPLKVIDSLVVEGRWFSSKEKESVFKLIINLSSQLSLIFFYFLNLICFLVNFVSTMLSYKLL